MGDDGLQAKEDDQELVWLEALQTQNHSSVCGHHLPREFPTSATWWPSQKCLCVASLEAAEWEVR